MNKENARAIGRELGDLLDVRQVAGDHTIFWTALDEISLALDTFLHSAAATTFA